MRRILSRYIVIFLAGVIASLTPVRLFAVEFHSINDIHHISFRELNSLCKDADGFVWASSKMGVVRLTNDDCRLYSVPYSKMNMVTLKLACHDNLLVAYSSDGLLFRYNPVNDKFENLINMSEAFNDNAFRISRLLIDDNRNLWISAATGLYKIEGQNVTLTNITDLTDCIEWIDDSTMIVARRHDILLFNTLTQKTIATFDSPLLNTIKSSLYYNVSTKQIWIGTKANGLYIFDLETKQCTPVCPAQLPKQPVLALEPLNDSLLMAGIDGQGLWIINSNTLTISDIYKKDNDNPSSLRGNGVYDILCEPGKRVWVCTYGSGVSFFDIQTPAIRQIRHKSNNRNSLSDDNVNAIIEDQRGNIWFATNNGISRLNPQNGQWQHLFADNQVQSQVFLSLCEDTDGHIWAGTYSSGVYVLDSNGRTLAHHSSKESNNLFDNDFVFDIVRDSLGDIWIGGVNDDYFQYDHRSGRFRRFDYLAINALAELDKQKMLLGCINGLFMLDKATGKESSLIDRNIINDILVKDNSIWVATTGYGLRRYDIATRQTEQFDTHNGLPSDFVTSIADGGDCLWIGTESGLCKFTPTGADGNQAYTIAMTEQLASVSFNRHAHYRLRNGNLVWGTNKGAIEFNPDASLEQPSNGKIYLQDISVAGNSVNTLNLTDKPVNQLDTLTLNYMQNNMRIELVPIGDIAGPKFAWQLAGLDNDWTQPSTDRVIAYTNLPDRDFDLHIKLYDNTLSHIIDERTLHIEITPPFWHRWWFVVISYLIVCLIVYMIITQYIQNIKRQHAEDKIRFFTNTAHEIRTSLTLIKAPIEELHKEKKLTAVGQRNLELASVQAQQLSAVVTQLMDFQKSDIGKERLQLAMADIVGFVSNRVQMFESMAAKSNIELNFAHNIDSYNSAIDANMMAKVVDNLISNAIKYSPKGGIVNIGLECGEKLWRLSVTDHGIGISRQAQKHLFTEFYRSENAVNSSIVGSGIGLMLVKNYVELHNGKVTCVSQEGKGSTFTIEIPVAVAEKRDSAPNATAVHTASQPIESKTVDSQESSITLLIVEDNENLLRFMRETLSDEFNILTAENGAVAWKNIGEQQPDIVISDIMMPEMDGFELCRLLKSTFETAHIPIILLTALSGRAEQLQGLGLGADDYLTKPFDMDILRLRLKTLVRNRQLTKSKIINSLSHGTPVELGNKQNDEFVQKLHLTVKENMGNCDFDKEQFAAAMNVSSSLLYKKIKALTDLSPTDFIKTARLEYAQKLLKTQKYNITEISEMCGFASAAYFSTVFKKQYGVAPSDYDGTEDISN